MTLEANKNKRAMSAFDLAWLHTYRASGRRAYLAKDASLNASRAYNAHALKPRTRVLTFLGLPDKLRVKGESFTARDVASTVFGIVMLPFSFVKNTAKLVTEFLPRAGYLGARKMSLHYGNVGQDHSPSKSMAMRVLAGMCYGLHFIGRAVTSPSQGVRQAYKAAYTDKNTGHRVLLPRPARIALSVFSGLMTATVYAVLLPFIAAVAAPGLVAAGATLVAKSAAVSTVMKGLALVGSFLTKALGLTYALAPVVAASSLAMTAGTAGCVIASEVDIHRKSSSTVKMSKRLGGKPGNGVESKSKSDALPGGRVASPVMDIPKRESEPEVSPETRRSFKR